MTIAQRVLLADFALANPLYANARVWVYEADATTGVATTTLATLYRAPTGTDEGSNPLTLDSAGKLQRPAYVDVPVIARVTDALVQAHDTGVIGLVQRFREEWEVATAYQVGDVIRDGDAGNSTGWLYISTQAHTSGAVFGDDLTAGQWVLYLQGGGGGGGSEIDASYQIDVGTLYANRLRLIGSTTGNALTINAVGSDSNIPIRLIPKGASRVEVRGGLTVGVASSSGGATFYGPLSGTGRAMLVSQSMILSGSTNGNVARFETAVSGTTTANPGFYTFSINDNLQAAAGANHQILSITYGGTLFQGGRNGQWINVNSNADCTNFGDAFLVAQAPWWRARHYHSGYPGAERGAVFGANPLGWLGNSGAIGARRMRGVQGQEVNFGSVHNTLYRTGNRMVEWGDSGLGGNIGVGYWQDASISYGRLTNANLPGVLTLHALGDSLGDWPLRATGATIMETQPTQIASPASYSAAIGFNLPDVTFDYASMWFPGFFVGASGDVGGRTVGGTTLQAVSGIFAKTATVASVTVVRGGLFISKPTLTFSAPVSGTTATGTVNQMAADWPFAMTGVFGSRGSGYVVGDALTMSGGTFTSAGVYTVRAVDSIGQIIDMEPTTPGVYTVLPSNPVTLTGGTGAGATVAPYWTILSVTVSNAGTGYSEQAPPSIAVSGGSGVKFRAPILVPQMTATAATLVLNAGDINVAGIPTSSAGLPSGRVWSNAGVLTVVP